MSPLFPSPNYHVSIPLHLVWIHEYKQPQQPQLKQKQSQEAIIAIDPLCTLPISVDVQ